MFEVGKVYRHRAASREFLILEVNPETGWLKFLLDNGICQDYYTFDSCGHTLADLFSLNIEVVE